MILTFAEKELGVFFFFCAPRHLELRLVLLEFCDRQNRVVACHIITDMHHTIHGDRQPKVK